MNSIFFRIYGGVVLTIILVSGLSYLGAEVVNGMRAESYRGEMARGTFYLMARGIQRQKTDEDVESWRDVLGRLMGADLTLSYAADVSLSDDERERLAAGKVVMQLNEERGFADIYFQLPGEQRYIVTRMNKVSEQQARATALLVLDELAQYPLDQWDVEFDRIREHFGFPMSRVAYNTLRLDQEQLQRLQRREVVLALDDSGSSQHSSVHVYSPIGNTGQVLVLGPMTLFDQKPIELIVIIGLIGLSAMGMAMYFLVRPLQARLEGLGRAVELVGRGNLNVKVEVQSSDAIGQLAATFNGMTEHIRRLIESQREMMRAVSHELRTPVARLRFGMEMMADTASEPERHRKLEELDRDVEQLNELIDEILTFARLEEGSPALEFDLIDVPALIRRLREELKGIAGQIEIVLRDDVTAADGDHPFLAEGAERYIHRVLQNLVTNALRYARHRIEVRYFVDGDLACVEVEDDGPGISVADRERIFLPFARLDESRQRKDGKSGGYGLGLSIVKRIAEWHGGKVMISDGGTLGGALFRLSWPREREGVHVLGDVGGE